MRRSTQHLSIVQAVTRIPGVPDSAAFAALWPPFLRNAFQKMPSSHILQL